MKATGHYNEVKDIDPWLVLNEHTREHIDHWVSKFPPERKRSALIQGLFAAQEQITAENADEKLTGIADSSGVKGTDMAACAAKPETQARVEASVTLGKALQVNSTPTLFVNGRPVGVNGNNYDALKKLVDFAATDK